MAGARGTFSCAWLLALIQGLGRSLQVFMCRRSPEDVLGELQRAGAAVQRGLAGRRCRGLDGLPGAAAGRRAEPQRRRRQVPQKDGRRLRQGEAQVSWHFLFPLLGFYYTYCRNILGL